MSNSSSNNNNTETIRTNSEHFDYGETFQQKVIANLIKDEKFLDQIIDVIKPEYFEQEQFQWFVNQIKDYYSDYNKPITYESVLIRLKRKKKTDPIIRDILSLAYIIFKDNASILLKDYEDIQHEVTAFCKRQEMKNAFLNGIELLQENRFEEVYKLVENAYNTGTSKDIGLDIDDIEDRTTNLPRKNILPLPSEALNKRIGGGIAEGEFVALIAPMGTGKSMWASNIVAHAKKTNTNAVLFTLEMEESYNRMRIDSILLNRPTDELHKAEHYLNDIKDELAKYTGKVFVKRYGESEVTALTLKSHIRMMKAKGIHPEWVVIDYLDIMDSIDPKNRHKQDWEKFDVISRDLARLAVSEKIRIFGLVQGNTSSMDKSVITAQNTAGGAKRLHPCHLILGYARTEHDKQNNTATLSIIKNRFGGDGFTMPVVTDYSKCYIEVQDAEVKSLSESHEPEDYKEKWKENYRKKYSKKLNKINETDDDGIEEFI